MPFPTPATKTNCDASTDDPKQALLTDLAQLVDKFNQLLAAAAAAGDLAASGITGAAALGGSAAQAFSVASATAVAHATRADQVQSQSLTAFTTAGTGSAFTLTPAPAITANAAKQRFNVTLHAAPSGSPTLAVSGQAALNFKYYDSSGTKQFITSAVAPNGWNSDVINDGTDWVMQKILPTFATTLTSESYIYIRDEKASGTAGGTFTAGAWQKRDLNTEVNDAGGHASLTSSAITLAAGTYRFYAKAPAYAVSLHKIKLKNTTDNIEYIGTSEFQAANVTTHSKVSGRFTITTSKNFELQHYCSFTVATNGFGYPASMGVTEVYAEIEFWKEF